MSDNEQKPQQKALIPHEHVVIPNQSLHPILWMQAHVISNERKLERYLIPAFLAWAVLINFMENTAKLTDIASSAVFYEAIFTGINVLTSDVKSRKRQVKKVLENKGVKNSNLLTSIAAFLTFPKIPSTYSRILTYEVPELIKIITQFNDAPFDDLDCARKLRDYNVGMFDKDMNLVLIKHPDSDYNREPTSGVKLMFRRLAWKQPFKRPRFEINPPEVKVKQELPKGIVPVVG